MIRVRSHNKEICLFVFLLVGGLGGYVALTGRNLTLTSGCHSTFKLKWQLWLAVRIWIVTAGVDFVQQGGETQPEHTSVNWPAAPFAKPEHWAIQSHTCGRGPHKIFFLFRAALVWAYMLIQIQNEWPIFTFWDHCGLGSEKEAFPVARPGALVKKTRQMVTSNRFSSHEGRECAMENCRKWVELGNLWRWWGYDCGTVHQVKSLAVSIQGNTANIFCAQTFQATQAVMWWEPFKIDPSLLCLAESLPEPQAILHCPLSALCLKPSLTCSAPWRRTRRYVWNGGGV